MHWGPDIVNKNPEDICTRVIQHETYPQMLSLELYSVATYNMMDPFLSMDVYWATDVMCLHIERQRHRGGACLGISVQGAGPHFCPGGNPNPLGDAGLKLRNGLMLKKWDFCQYVGYAPFTRIRELAVPTVQGSHGGQVGGGNAYALNHTKRACDAKTTISFGNVSRGMVPGMLLSGTLTSTCGIHPAMDLYLTDNTLTAYGALKANFMDRIYPGILQTKEGAKEICRAMASNPLARTKATLQISVMDTSRFAEEALGIEMAGRSGTTMASVRLKSYATYITDFASGPRSSALSRISSKAIRVHGIEETHGILHMANVMANWCWATLSDNAKLEGSKDHPARYSDEAGKAIHKPAHDSAAQYLNIWQSVPNKRGQRRIDAWQVAEAVAFCFWRDRDISVEVIDIQPRLALSKTSDGDLRRDLLGKNKFSVAEDVIMSAIVVNSSSVNALHFEDPVKRFGKEKSDVWWQFAAMGSSGVCSMLLLSALLGACADPNVLLSCDGEEVADINMCRGRYIGPVMQVAVKEVSRSTKAVFPSQAELSGHDWVCIRTTSGKQICIDFSAVQYGDASRSECSGVPFIFKPAEEFHKDFKEEKRDKDPVAVYTEYFLSMLRARRNGSVGKSNFCDGGRMEEFFSVLSKSLALLALV
jgi:enoyl-CoA hydratase/carnithine racemase